jgi:hypothetical protein
MGIKLVELFVNRVDERRNMINDYLRGSWFQGECCFWAFVLRLSFSCFSWAFLSSSLSFCLALPLFVPFVGFCCFPSPRWPFWAFLGFSCFMRSWIQTSNFVFLLSMDSSREDWETKWSVSWFDCDESLTWRGLNSNSGQFHFVFLLSLFHLENRVCLSHGVQVAGAA